MPAIGRLCSLRAPFWAAAFLCGAGKEGIDGNSVASDRGSDCTVTVEKHPSPCPLKSSLVFAPSWAYVHSTPIGKEAF